MNPCLRYATMIGARPGELPEEEARDRAEHRASCEACQARLADEEALAGMLSAALLDEANRRDFSTFSDGVLARIPEYARSGRAPGVLSRLGGWIRHHRLVAAASALAPALAALALVVYLGRSGSTEVASVEISSERGSATVLETSDGPVVLLGDDEPEGS